MDPYMDVHMDAYIGPYIRPLVERPMCAMVCVPMCRVHLHAYMGSCIVYMNTCMHVSVHALAMYTCDTCALASCALPWARDCLGGGGPSAPHQRQKKNTRATQMCLKAHICPQGFKRQPLQVCVPFRGLRKNAVPCAKFHQNRACDPNFCRSG